MHIHAPQDMATTEVTTNNMCQKGAWTLSKTSLD